MSAWKQMPRAWSLEPGAREYMSQEPRNTGARSKREQEKISQSQSLGYKIKEPGARSPEPGAMSHEP